MAKHFTWLLTAAALAAGPAAAEPAFEAPAICRAAIAAIADRDPKAIQTTHNGEGELLLTYARPFDNFVWTYRCRIEGDRVVWADEPGRWREGPRDNKITFETLSAGAQLRITVTRADGSSTHQEFDRDKLQ